MLEGFEVGRNDMVVSHLQFVDETIIMCKDSAQQIKYLGCVIRYFDAVSGLKVNLFKSRMYGVGQVENLEKLAEKFGCQVVTLPTT